MEVAAVPAGGRRVEQPGGRAGHLDRGAGEGVTSRSTRSYSRPRPQETASAPAGTASATSRAWKYGRWVASHLCGTPSGNQAPPLGSLTDHRAQCGGTAAGSPPGTSAPRRRWCGGAVDLDLERPGDVDGGDAGAGGRYGDLFAGPRTASGRPAAESTTTSTAAGVPAIVARAGPTSGRTAPPASTRTTTTPPGGSAPTTSRTADGQSPVRCAASKTGPSSENRAQRNMSGNPSSPQPKPWSASSRR